MIIFFTEQRIFWQSRLQQCEVLQNYLARETHNDSVTVSNIINLILDSMVMVCHNSMDANNPAGASNVNPALMPKTPANFEDIINHVFTQNGIATLPDNNYFCNPYSVDYPKPYGSNPPVFEVKKGSVDSCNCAQFATLKVSAKAAGYDTASFSSLNQYLLANYGDTLSLPLWQGLLHCNDESTTQCNTIYTGHVVLDMTCPDCGNSYPYNGPVITNVTEQLPPTNSNADAMITVTYTLDPHADSSFLRLQDIALPGIRYIRLYGGNSITENISSCHGDFVTVESYYTYPPGGQNSGVFKRQSNSPRAYTECTATCTTIAVLPVRLTAVTTVPSFLSCGYSKPCITCDQLQAYTTAFRQLYPAYSSVPYTSNVDTGQAKQNALWARYLNYKTGFSKAANEQSGE